MTEESPFSYWLNLDTVLTEGAHSRYHQKKSGSRDRLEGRAGQLPMLAHGRGLFLLLAIMATRTVGRSKKHQQGLMSSTDRGLLQRG